MSAKNVKIDAISQLCELVEDGYVKKLLAKDESTLERWESNVSLHLREGFLIKLIQEDHRNIVNLAVASWKERELIILKLFDGSYEEFSQMFTFLHAKILCEKSISRCGNTPMELKINLASQRSRLLVRNIGWCRKFCYFLPLIVPDMKAQLAQIGGMMSAVFYLEMLEKAKDRSQQNDLIPLDTEFFEELYECWSYAQELV